MPEHCRLVCIAPARVQDFLVHARPFLERAARRSGEASVAAIEESLVAGRALIWLVWASEQRIVAVVVTELVASAAGLVCVIVSCAGAGLPGWLPLIREIECYAAREGCVAVRIYGRKGWARVLKDYRAARVILERRLKAAPPDSIPIQAGDGRVT